MIALISSIRKELLLLLRDRAGLLFLFVMPIVLVILMTLLQDKTIKKLQVEKMDIAVVNQDNGLVSDAILQGLSQMQIFTVHQVYNDDTLTVEAAQNAVAEGKYQMAVLIPYKTTSRTKRIISNELRKQLPSMGGDVLPDSLLPQVELKLYFDPIMQGSLRLALHSALNQLMADVRTNLVFKSYASALEKMTGNPNDGMFLLDKFAVIEEENSSAQISIPSSTQHNVPAWTVFAIFFMVVPLSSQIISEREEGSILRLQMSSTPIAVNFISRIVVYSLLAVVQGVTLLVIGEYLLPLLGMDKFNIHNSYFSFLSFTFIVGLAASAFGIAIGSIAKSHQQASIIGSISVVILAAIGGIWVPTYMMPENMALISSWSPLNWALTGYYNLVLKNFVISQLGDVIIKILLFFVISLSIAVIFGKRKNV
jgi:ABC-2 type transport system permease protein